ncbi:NitT/TauT family transport system permease protein [Ancylobacter sp. 3268]|uniref:ABC transporter permease n=1 Tax=Ancylobacter sp. 3268 TaxID=2817752 RepID=UPI00286449D4|nr:ABC transporter permease subunit [Ancylobacter sp. 3268]MDR6951157.1 NitT/TauT family transport system permease protein [Ancylobacter sp. 3268]
MSDLSSTPETRTGSIRLTLADVVPTVPRPLVDLVGLLAAVVWFAVAAAALGWEDVGDWPRTQTFAVAAGLIAAGILVVSLAGRWLGGVSRRLDRAGLWLIVLGLFFTLWQLASAKLGWVPLPFFPPPQALLEVYLDDFPRLGESILASVKLQLWGYSIGAVAGFLLGASIGWSQRAAYWVHPVLRFIGPLPAGAWLPIAFFAFPSSWSAGIFLIALATGFPVTVLTWSGILSVNPAYYDVARTLGARSRFLMLKVAIPAALPHVFVGLFMALGTSFSVLVVAELLGVKAGLGFYMQAAQGWGDYANLYAALLVLALLCSGAVSLLFAARDRFLSWQKDIVTW